MTDFTDSNREIIDLIITESRHRQIVPFVGSGISFSSGFPTIAPIIQYLAKVDFAIQAGIYRDRFPSLSDSKKGQKKLVNHYRQHPALYIRDCGWPNFGGLDADLWAWLESSDSKILKKIPKCSELAKDIDTLEKRYHLLAIIQWSLRQEQEQGDEGTKKGTLLEWNHWKKWLKTGRYKGKKEPRLLYGNWEMLLDKLCEGDFGLVDRLFIEFERGLFPAHSHRLLALLQSKLGIPLILTTNFDSLLDEAFDDSNLTPKIFDIHRDSELPDPILVEQQFSILKLHGSAYGLRFGERLRQKLEVEAKSFFKQYLPKNALVLVLGFSGSERRTMQLLQSFVEDDNNNHENPRLIWVQGPGKPAPRYHQLVESNHVSKKVRSCQIKHSDAFLQELYFKLANSHQSLSKPYLSQSEHYLTELKLELPIEEERKNRNITSPLQVFVANQGQTITGSWATFAGMAFVQSLHQHRIIWISLENHETVESIVAELFMKVRLLDPQSPSFNFSLMDQLHDDQVIKRTMKKAADRICDIFQRGKFALVFDSLESFARPPMVHHGIPNFRDTTKNIRLLEKCENNIKNLQIFIEELSKKSADYKDSYIIITIDKPRERHSYPSKSDTNNQALQCLNVKIDAIIEFFGSFDRKKKTIHLLKQGDKTYKYFLPPLLPESPKPIHDLPIDPISKININWKSPKNEGDLKNRTLNRVRHVFFLIKLLRTKNCSDNTIQYDGVLSSFVSLMAFCRQPRSLALRYAIVDRWVLRKIFGRQLSEKKADQTHQVVEHLLDIISLSESSLVKNNNNSIILKSTNEPPLIGVPLLEITKSSDKNAVGILAQRNEGGTIWMLREAQEETYCSVTELLHLQGWVNTWLNRGDLPNYKDIPILNAVLDGMLSISWHLNIARAYYVNIFMPTQDIQAFYEYLYHRISSLRTITLLLVLIQFSKDDPDPCEIIKNLDDLREQTEIKSNFKNSVLWYAEMIGIFAENPKYRFNDASEQTEYHGYLTKQLLDLRHNALETLWMALQRNSGVFKANSTPEILLSWSTQFINRELPEITGEVFVCNKNGNNKLSEIYKEIGLHDKSESAKLILNIKNYFKDLEHRAYLSMLDFECDLKNIKLESDNKLDYTVSQAIKADSKVDRELFKRFFRSLIYFNPSGAKNLSKEQKLTSDFHDLKAKSFLAEYSLWKPLMDRQLPCYGKEGKKNELSIAEQEAILYENKLRLTSQTSEEDAEYRSDAFSVRARTLFLRNHFRLAHHFLDLASSGLHKNRFGHRSNVAIIHIIRAELLATSADSHYRDALKTISKDKAIEKEGGMSHEVFASFKKIERAKQELNAASDLFATISHLRVWSIFLELGHAQLKMEQLLYEMEILYISYSHSNISNTEYLRKSGKVEQNILDCMGKLREVLDLLPFISDTWGKVNSEQRRSLPLLIEIEIMCYRLWRDLFIVGAYYDSLLRILSNIDKDKKLNIETIIGNILKPRNSAHYLKRWERWCYSMRFRLMGKYVKLSFSLDADRTKGNKKKNLVSSISLRENIIQEMKKTAYVSGGIFKIHPEIKVIWDGRRSLNK